MYPDIEFEFEGNHYTVSFKAYNLDRIELPDGRLLRVNGWNTNVYPPVPIELVVINKRTGPGHFARSVFAELKDDTVEVKPIYVLVGDGSGQCIVELERGPFVGQEITFTYRMIKSIRTDTALLLLGHTYKVTKISPAQDTGPDFGTIPWISLKISI
jgi:hypothetical protein